MAYSLALIVLLGLLFNKLFIKMKLPGLLGMLILGMIIGPYGFNWIDETVMTISGDLRKIALIVILIRAGLGIHRDTLNRVGVSAIKLSCIPGIFEGLTIMMTASYLLKISKIEAAMLGFILAAVSPAVIVPQMLQFIEKRMGEEKGIPTLILAAASVDDVVAITIFSGLLGMYGGKQVSLIRQFLNIPFSIVVGILLGLFLSIVLISLFNRTPIRNTKKALIVFSAAILLVSIEEIFRDIIPVAGLLGVMMIGFVILERKPDLAGKLSNKFNKIWIFAEIILFVLVGAQVNLYLAVDAGWIGMIIVVIGLLARSVGVYISLLGSNFNRKEKLFCVISYIPKATVQAAIGGVPLAAGVVSGELILAFAVLAIIITAPIGAIGIQIAGEKTLSKVNPYRKKMNNRKMFA